MTLQTRYGTRTHTPGDNKPASPTIIRNDPAVLTEWDTLHDRLSELKANLINVKGEIAEILAHLGRLVAEGANYKKSTDRLAELRAETEALEAGIQHLADRAELMKRLNHWLTLD